MGVKTISYGSGQQTCTDCGQRWRGEHICPVLNAPRDCQLCRAPHYGELCPWPAIEERARALDAIADVADACGVSMEERLALLRELGED